MFENVDTRRENEDFEKKITQIYNKYSKIEISDEYLVCHHLPVTTYPRYL